MKYVNKKNGKVVVKAEFQDKYNTYLLEFEDGTNTKVTSSTLKRWYKAIPEDGDAEEVTPAPAPTPAPVEEPDDVEQPAPAPTDKKKAAKPAGKRHKAAESKQYVEDAKEFVYNTVRGFGDEIFVPASGIKMRTFKVGGHMYAKFNYSNTSITLAVKPDVIDGTDLRKPDRELNHMFRYVYLFQQELTDDDKQFIADVLGIARRLRIDKNNKTTKKEDK